ncbi:MFS transporter [Arthrobacter sp. UYCo732]|uniref:MFS transporter n=1 Tax=Arthrobacter sp. UYCo732 TaxID=3156336 RepID=UPI0033994926
MRTNVSGPRNATARPNTAVLLRSAYLPAALLTGAATAALPAIIAVSLEHGASPAEAGVVTTAIAAGNMIATLPGGRAVARFGAGRMLPVSGGLIAAALLGILLAPGLPLLIVSMLALGAGSGVHTVARIAGLTDQLHPDRRAEVFSVLSAWLRVGMVAGPLLGAGAYALTGQVHSPVVAGLGLAVIAAVLHVADRQTGSSVDQKPRRTAPGLTGNRGEVLRVGAIHAAVTSRRHIKTILVPLIALSIGMDVGQVSLLTAVASVVGFGGIWLGIRLGRILGPVRCGTLSCAGISIGLIAMMLVSGPLWLSAVALGIEVATGLGAGFLSLLASRTAPAENRAPMIALFQLVSEASAVIGPAAVMGVVALWALPAGAAAGAVIGVAGTCLLIRGQARDTR